MLNQSPQRGTNMYFLIVVIVLFALSSTQPDSWYVGEPTLISRIRKKVFIAKHDIIIIFCFPYGSKVPLAICANGLLEPQMSVR